MTWYAPSAVAGRLSGELVTGWVARAEGRQAPKPSACASGPAVPAMADAIGLSERQLHRRCLSAFGYGPSTLRRILRRGGVPETYCVT